MCYIMMVLSRTLFHVAHATFQVNFLMISSSLNTALPGQRHCCNSVEQDTRGQRHSAPLKTCCARTGTSLLTSTATEEPALQPAQKAAVAHLICHMIHLHNARRLISAKRFNIQNKTIEHTCKLERMPLECQSRTKWRVTGWCMFNTLSTCFSCSLGLLAHQTYPGNSAEASKVTTGCLCLPFDQGKLNEQDPSLSS